MKFEAITFDFWNTLVLETTEALDRRKALWAELLAEEGFDVSSERLNDAFKHGWEQFDKRWRANEQSSVVDVTADVITNLALPIGNDLQDRLAAAYLEASEHTPRLLLPQVEQTLDRLQSSGIRVGVICDVGTVPSAVIQGWLRDLDVHHYVDHFSFSDEVGVYKPHPDIFRHALDGLGVADPTRAAHIGDLKRTDVAGARAAGMTSIRYAGARADDSEGADADHVIDRHTALFDILA